MVVNSFGKRNFMQPMGRPKHAIKVPCFFLVSLGGGAGGEVGWKVFFFHFSLVPNVFYVPFEFPMDSHQVPNMFPKFQIGSPTYSP
jgi:hypothetical protein